MTPLPPPSAFFSVSGSPVQSSGYAQSGFPSSPAIAGARLAHAFVHSVAPSLPWTWNPLRGTSAARAPMRHLLLAALPVLLGLAVLIRTRGVLAAILIVRAGQESPRRPLLFPSLAMVVALATFVYGLINTYNAGQLELEQSIFAGLVKQRFGELRVGAFQSGVIGYYNSNTFNLDGKLDHAALRYLKDGRISGYIEEKRMDVLVDWDEQFDTFMASPAERGCLASRWRSFRLENPSPGRTPPFLPELVLPPAAGCGRDHRQPAVGGATGEAMTPAGSGPRPGAACQGT